MIVTGNPTYTCDVQMMGDDGDHNTGGLVGTAARIIERDPRGVRGAEPGLLSVLDLPADPRRPRSAPRSDCGRHSVALLRAHRDFPVVLLVSTLFERPSLYSRR